MQRDRVRTGGREGPGTRKPDDPFARGNSTQAINRTLSQIMVDRCVSRYNRF